MSKGRYTGIIEDSQTANYSNYLVHLAADFWICDIDVIKSYKHKMNRAAIEEALLIIRLNC